MPAYQGTRVALDTLFVISQPIFKRFFVWKPSIRYAIWKKGKKINIRQHIAEEIKKCVKNIKLNLSTGGCMISKKLKRLLFPEELFYKSWLVIVQNFLLPCTTCTQEKGIKYFTLNFCIFETRGKFKNSHNIGDNRAARL